MDNIKENSKSTANSKAEQKIVGSINNNKKADDKSTKINHGEETTQPKAQDTDKKAAQAVARSVFGARRKTSRNFKGSKSNRKDEFEQRILDLARVTRVIAGGKRLRFRATVAVGDKAGKVGVGLGKGTDVTIAITKAVNKAKKNIIDVPMINETIPHDILNKFGAAKILFKPARKGRGVIAGGVVRIILELAGIKNATSKILGTNNKVSNAKCTIEALKKLKRVEIKR